VKTTWLILKQEPLLNRKKLLEDIRIEGREGLKAKISSFPVLDKKLLESMKRFNPKSR
jgi:hypothetical protein